MKSKYTHKFWCAGILSAALPLIAAAEEGGDLGTIDVTAQRTAAPTSLSPRPVTVIDREQIEAAHADNLVTLLEGRSDVVVRDTSGVGAKSSVDLGGFGESAPANAVVLVDGRRVNSPDLSGVDWTQIPVDQIERIEIVHGGSSVLYGDGAVGGVINIITRIPESGGEISVTGGSFGTASGGLRIGADSGGVRVEGNLSGYSTDGYRINGRFERYDGGARFELDLPRGAMLYGGGNHHRDRYGLPGPLTAAQLSADRRQSLTPADAGETVDSYLNAGALIPFAGAELDLPASVRRRESNAVYGGFAVSSTLRTFSLRPKLDWQSSGDDWYRSLVLGIDVDRVDGSVGGFEAERRRSGAYLSGSVGDAERRYLLSAGLRTEGVRDTLTGAGGGRVNGRELAYDVGLVVRRGGFRLHLDHNRSLRFPLLDERYDYTNNTWNGALLPQIGRHYVAGVAYDAAPFRIGLSFSRADIEDEIFFNPTGGAFGFGANENYADATRHDVLMLRAAWRGGDRLRLSGSWTWARATFRGGPFAGNDIPAVPEQRAALRWDADWGNGFFSGVTVRYVGGSRLISDQANVRPLLPAYTVVDATASYRWNDLRIFARVDNLTDEKYSSYGVFSAFSGDNFYPAPGIGARVGVDYSF